MYVKTVWYSTVLCGFWPGLCVQIKGNFIWVLCITLFMYFKWSGEKKNLRCYKFAIWALYIVSFKSRSTVSKFVTDYSFVKFTNHCIELTAAFQNWWSNAHLTILLWFLWWLFVKLGPCQELNLFLVGPPNICSVHRRSVSKSCYEMWICK